MAQYNEAELKELSHLCKYIKHLLPEDNGVSAMTDNIAKTMNVVNKQNYMVFHGLFGYKALLGWMEYLSDREEYEKCQEIMLYLQATNKRKIKNKIPTKLEIENPSL